MSLFVDTLYNFIQKRVAAGYTYMGFPVYNASKADLQLIEDSANWFGFRPEWLANLINNESAGTFNPAIVNSIGATGLIQIMPDTAPDVGTTTAALKAMTFAEQMVYVNKYIYMWYTALGWLDADKNPIKGKMQETDLFMMIFYPAAVGNPTFEFPPAVTAENNGIKTPEDYYDFAIANAPFKNLLPDDPTTDSVKLTADNSKIVNRDKAGNIS
jgi:hypothetical protein